MLVRVEDKKIQRPWLFLRKTDTGEDVMAGLNDYSVELDFFEFDVHSMAFAFSFPCCVCAHRSKRDDDPPCNRCDHNVNAIQIGEEVEP